MNLSLGDSMLEGVLHRRPIFASTAILVVIMAGMWIQLGSLPFFEPDESRYVEVSREMLETGECIIPQLNYQTLVSMGDLSIGGRGGTFFLCRRTIRPLFYE